MLICGVCVECCVLFGLHVLFGVSSVLLVVGWSLFVVCCVLIAVCCVCCVLFVACV